MRNQLCWFKGETPGSCDSLYRGVDSPPCTVTESPGQRPIHSPEYRTTATIVQCQLGQPAISTLIDLKEALSRCPKAKYVWLRFVRVCQYTHAPAASVCLFFAQLRNTGEV
jgi:hypothetical protein